MFVCDISGDTVPPPGMWSRLTARPRTKAQASTAIGSHREGCGLKVRQPLLRRQKQHEASRHRSRIRTRLGRQWKAGNRSDQTFDSSRFRKLGPAPCFKPGVLAKPSQDGQHGQGRAVQLLSDIRKEKRIEIRMLQSRVIGARHNTLLFWPGMSGDLARLSSRKAMRTAWGSVERVSRPVVVGMQPLLELGIDDIGRVPFRTSPHGIAR